MTLPKPFMIHENDEEQLAREVMDKCEEAMELLMDGLEEVFIPYDGSEYTRSLYKTCAKQIYAHVRFGGIGEGKWKYVVWFSIPRRKK